jgi:hypothetical protein
MRSYVLTGWKGKRSLCGSEAVVLRSPIPCTMASTRVDETIQKQGYCKEKDEEVYGGLPSHPLPKVGNCWTRRRSAKVVGYTLKVINSGRAIVLAPHKMVVPNAAHVEKRSQGWSDS